MRLWGLRTCAFGLQEELASFVNEFPSVVVAVGAIVVVGFVFALGRNGSRRSTGSGLGLVAPHFFQSFLSSFQQCFSIHGSPGWLSGNR